MDGDEGVSGPAAPSGWRNFQILAPPDTTGQIIAEQGREFNGKKIKF